MLFEVRFSAAPLFVLALGLGCGSETTPPANNNNNSLCATDARAETYTAGLQRMTEEGRFRVTLEENLYEGSPRAPDRGMNAWRIKVTDIAGTNMSAASVVLRPWMPDHGHGTTPLDIEATLRADQQGFDAGPFNLFMGGYWEFTVQVDDGGTSDEAVFGFCLEG